MPIALRSILPVLDPREYKVHLAGWDGENHPLDVFVQDRNEWKQWNAWRSKRDDFNRQYIFSLIDFYPEPGIWLFGGIYRIVSLSPQDCSHSYEVNLEQTLAEYAGRLKVDFKRPGRVRSVQLEKYYARMVVSELLREPYSGEQFPGYENISHDFSFLETIFRLNKPVWKNALANAKGVYLIADKQNGKKYVGSAYGKLGIWARWHSYIETGHGGNDDLIKLIQEKGIEYARKNFRLSLLEYWPDRTDDLVIIERESHWKEALLSRKFGYNRN